MQTSQKNNKRIAKNTVYLYIRMLLVMAVSLYTSRVILDVLGVNDYGVYNVVGCVVSMLSFVSSAMGTAVQRFLSFEIGRGDNEELKKVFSLSFMAHVLLALLLVIIAETVGLWFVENKLTIAPNRLPAAIFVHHTVVASAAFSIIQVPYNAMIFAKERMSFFAFISIIEVVLKLLIVYVLVIGDIDKLKLYGLLTLGVQILISLILYFYVTTKYNEAKLSYVNDWRRLRTIVSFAGWTMFGELSWAFTGQGVNIILNMFFGPTVNAARGIAEQVNSAVGRFVSNFQQAINPQMIKTYAVDDYEDLKKLLYRGTKFSLFLQLFLMVPLYIRMEYVLSLWLKEVPDLTADFCRLMLISALVHGFSNLLATVARAYGKIRKYQMVVSFFLFLNFPLSYMFLWLGFSPLSTMFVHIGIGATLLAVRLLLTRPMINLSIRDYALRVVLPCLAVSVCCFMIPLYISNYIEQSFFGLVVLCLVSTITSAALIWVLGLSQHEKQWVVTLAKRKLRK